MLIIRRLIKRTYLTVKVRLHVQLSESQNIGNVELMSTNLTIYFCFPILDYMYHQDCSLYYLGIVFVNIVWSLFS